MALHITPSDTSSIEVAAGDAFADNGTLVPDFTLIVDANAFLISDSGGNGAKLTGSWTVTVNGAVEGGFLGISLDLASTVTVGRNGDVFGGNDGIFAPDGLTLTNFGAIGSDLSFFAISCGGELHIKNAGKIAGYVASDGATNDSFTDFIKVGKVIKNGTLTAAIILGAGDDHFNGGANAETVQDGDGADTTKLGGGNDTYIAKFNFLGDGIDVIDGGKGAADLYDASTVASVDLIINLDSVAHTDVLTGTPNTAAVKDSIFFYPPETITGFENASGGNGNDSIFGTSAANVLTGNVGFDGLFGYGGNDRLLGGDGADNIFGGKGSDILTGGADADTFNFVSLSDSTVAQSGRDTITDFNEIGIDKIDLSKIDAVKGGSDDAFTYIGAKNFHHVAGELRESFTDGGDTIVSGDVNGDGKADFAITLTITLNGHILLHDTDFVL